MRMRKLASVLAAAAMAVPAGMFGGGCEKEDPILATTATTAPAPAVPGAASRPMAAATKPKAVAEERFKPDPTGPFTPHQFFGQVIQTVRGLHRPHSTAVGLDGKSFFVTNSANTLDGYQYTKGAISRFEFDASDGRVKLQNVRWVTGLHAPLGIAVLPKATKKFPAGTLFVATGATSGIDESGERIADVSKFKPGVTLVDPESGSFLGHIPMGPGTAVAKSKYHPVLTPNGLTFDKDANLYLADSGNSGRELQPEIYGRPGIVRIKFQDIDAYSDNREPAVGVGVAFVPVLHEPAPVFYSKFDHALYWTTSDGKGDAGGAGYQMPCDEFPQKNAVKNILGGLNLGPLLGVAITPVRQVKNSEKPGGLERVGGSFIASRLDGDIRFMNKIISPLNLLGDENLVLSTPADIKLHALPNGNNILYVPEQEPNSTREWSQRLRVILLPSGI